MTENKPKVTFSKVRIFVSGLILGVLVFMVTSPLYMKFTTDKMLIHEFFTMLNSEGTRLLLKDLDNKEYSKINDKLEKKLESDLLFLVDNVKLDKLEKNEKSYFLSIKTFLATRPINYSSEENKQKISSFLNEIK